MSKQTRTVTHAPFQSNMLKVEQDLFAWRACPAARRETLIHNVCREQAKKFSSDPTVSARVRTHLELNVYTPADYGMENWRRGYQDARRI